MKVLFISIGNKIDYQCDCVFHGLNSLPGLEIYILNEYHYMFQGNEDAFLKRQYGMGFSITNRIPLHKKRIHSISQAQENIKLRFYDLIIYGSIHRYNVLLEDVLKTYPKKRLIFIDGEDFDFNTKYRKRLKGLIKQPISYKKTRDLAIYYSQKGIYFKRELSEKYRKNFEPIFFAIPEENIVKIIPDKTMLTATIVPGKLDTYIYNNEQDYYKGYQIAKFGITTKKSGWDCLRHYEILANGCIPYFPDLKNCPRTTMFNFPKEIILETNYLYENNTINDRIYCYFNKLLYNYTRQNLTTKALATYLLSYID